MNSNEILIHQFYTAFQNGDYKTMQNCYADDATFSDPVFPLLTAFQVKKMWEMFCKGGNAKVEYKSVEAASDKGKANWIASYQFKLTGNPVVNNIWAEFTFREGKIIKQVDHFNFYHWSSQALGIKGKLLGWTPFVKSKVQNTANKSLLQFIEKNPNL